MISTDEVGALDKLKGANQGLQNFAIQFTYNTQAIEGSTITLKETCDILIDNETPKNRSAYFIKETQNHYILFKKILDKQDEISMSVIQRWHYDQFKDTKPEIAGATRVVDVGIYGSDIKFPEWKAVPYHLIEFFQWYDRVGSGLHPVYLAALAHLKFVNIHPFEDGNGRTSRLLMNYILHKNGYPMLDIKYKDRKEYFESLNMAREYDQWEFVKFISKKMLGEKND